MHKSPTCGSIINIYDRKRGSAFEKLKKVKYANLPRQCLFFSLIRLLP